MMPGVVEGNVLCTFPVAVPDWVGEAGLTGNVVPRMEHGSALSWKWSWMTRRCAFRFSQKLPCVTGRHML